MRSILLYIVCILLSYIFNHRRQDERKAYDLLSDEKKRLVKDVPLTMDEIGYVSERELQDIQDRFEKRYVEYQEIIIKTHRRISKG